LSFKNLEKNPIAMNRRPCFSGRGRGFTLIELLVVIAIIGVVTAGIGLSFRSDGTTSLASAQGTLKSAIAGARAQAAITQRNTALFVNATPGSEGFLREMKLATLNAAGTRWVVRGEGFTLPSSIYVAPPSSVFATSEVLYQRRDGTNGTQDWTYTSPSAGEFWSTSYVDADINLRNIDDTDDLKVVDASNNSISAIYHRLVTLTPRGTTSSPTGTGNQVVLTLGEQRAEDLVVLNRPDTLRGLKVSKYGVATSISDPEGFK
jgi:prepilin-type N-terminal cleavage/methylation domain-containing protein